MINTFLHRPAAPHVVGMAGEARNENKLSLDRDSNLSAPQKTEELGVRHNRLAMREAKRFVERLVLIPDRIVMKSSPT